MRYGCWSMADAPENTPLEHLVELLNRHRVEFLLIGGQAELLFGSPRVTYDIDVCYGRTPDNIRRLADALAQLHPRLRGAPPDLPFRADAATLSAGLNFTFDTTLGAIDFLGEVEPLGTYERLKNRAEKYALGNTNVETIALDDLIAVKRHIARFKDSESLFQLLAIKRIRDDRGGQPTPTG